LNPGAAQQSLPRTAERFAAVRSRAFLSPAAGIPHGTPWMGRRTPSGTMSHSATLRGW